MSLVKCRQTKFPGTGNLYYCIQVYLVSFQINYLAACALLVPFHQANLGLAYIYLFVSNNTALLFVAYCVTFRIIFTRTACRLCAIKTSVNVELFNFSFWRRDLTPRIPYLRAADVRQ